jgi:citrate synthase
MSAGTMANNAIEPDLYAKYNVKRGLRNADGTGVLVGLTRVGDVHGYIIDEGERVAVPGKLYYRGIDVEELVAAAAAKSDTGTKSCLSPHVRRLPSKEGLADFCGLLGEKRILRTTSRKTRS